MNSDQEPPSFSGCPKTSVEKNLGPSGPVPVTIDIPHPSDNSGGALTVTYEPADFRQPYTFRQVCPFLFGLTFADKNSLLPSATHISAGLRFCVVITFADVTDIA